MLILYLFESHAFIFSEITLLTAYYYILSALHVIAPQFCWID